jgi:hypothetical protein
MRANIETITFQDLASAAPSPFPSVDDTSLDAVHGGAFQWIQNAITDWRLARLGFGSRAQRMGQLETW